MELYPYVYVIVYAAVFFTAAVCMVRWRDDAPTRRISAALGIGGLLLTARISQFLVELLAGVLYVCAVLIGVLVVLALLAACFRH